MGKAAKVKSNRKNVAENIEIVQAPELLTGLVSLQSSTREATCVALASIFGDNSMHNGVQRKRALESLMKANVVSKLIPRVVDHSMTVRLHAVGALRNMSVAGGVEVCERMTEADVMTVLLRVMKDGVNRLDSKDGRVVMEGIEQTIGLCCNLCESSKDAVDHVAKVEVFTLLNSLLGKCDSKSLLLEVAKFMIVVTDDHKVLCEQLASEKEFLKAIKTTVSDKRELILVRLNFAGALLNMPQRDVEVTRLVFQVIEEVLTYDTQKLLEDALHATRVWDAALGKVADIHIENNAKAQDEVNVAQEERKNAMSVQQAWKSEIQSKILAIEIASNFLSLADNADENQPEWDTDDECMSTEDDGLDLCNPLGLSDLSLFKQLFQTVDHIFRSVITVPSTLCRDIALDFATLRDRCCNCHANLIHVLPPQEMSDFNGYFSMLLGAYQHWQQHDNLNLANIDFEASITNALYSITKRSQLCGASMHYTNEHMTFLIAQYAKCTSGDAKVHLVGLLGNIGSSVHTIPENAIIGQFLHQCLSDPSVLVMAEALNAIFDMYSEETYNTNFKSMFASLQSLSSCLKSKIRAESKTLSRTSLEHLKETRYNLVRFIDYKNSTL